MPTVEYVRAMPGRQLHRPFFWVQGPKVGIPVQGIIIAEVLCQVVSHFCTSLNRHQPTAKGTLCPLCGKLGSRLKGYAAALFGQLRQPFVLEFSQGAIDQLAKLTAGRSSLRGMEVKLSRRPNAAGETKKNSPVDVRSITDHSPEKLPPAFPEMPHLEVMWGMAERAD